MDRLPATETRNTTENNLQFATEGQSFILKNRTIWISFLEFSN